MEKLITLMINDGDFEHPHEARRNTPGYLIVTAHVVSMQMRRPLAIIFALFFALGPLQAVFGESENLRLPACCRRNGVHHCEMNEEMLATLAKIYSGTPSFAAPATCSEFPGSALSFS